jgi:uncharacterized RDD family membrane protein YckC
VNTIEPGWYKDPAEPTTQRYWDGEGWIGEPLPVDATPPPGPPPSPPQPSTPPQAPPSTPPSAPGPGAIPAAGPTTTGAATGAPWPPPGIPLPPGTQPPPGYPIHPAYARPFAPAPQPHGYPLADVGQRLVARLIDIAALLVINAVVNGWFIYLFIREVLPWYRTIYQRSMANLPIDDVPRPANAQTLMFTITAIAAALWFAYEVPALANSGQTLGKRLLGIKVLRLEADSPLGFGRAWRRWNPLGIATLLWTCCGIGFVFQFIDCLFVAIDQPLHQALHDKSAATVVVDVKHRQSGDPK